MPHSLHLSKLLTCGLTLVLASTPSLPVIACLSSDAQTTPAPYLQITLHATYYHVQLSMVKDNLVLVLIPRLPGRTGHIIESYWLHLYCVLLVDLGCIPWNRHL